MFFKNCWATASTVPKHSSLYFQPDKPRCVTRPSPIHTEYISNGYFIFLPDDKRSIPFSNLDLEISLCVKQHSGSLWFLQLPILLLFSVLTFEWKNSKFCLFSDKIETFPVFITFLSSYISSSRHCSRSSKLASTFLKYNLLCILEPIILRLSKEIFKTFFTFEAPWFSRPFLL